MLRAIMIWACLTAASPAMAEISKYTTPCSVLPPSWARGEPNVPYVVIEKTDHRIQTLCGPAANHITACEMDPGTAKDRNAGRGDVWIIILPVGVSGPDRACLLMYEKAHLPPFQWFDQSWETHVRNG